MDLPKVGTVSAPDGKWDLRSHVESIFAGYEFEGQSVVEIGPASGFLTFEMEKRGAQVVAVDAAPDHEWDIVPFPGLREMWGPASRLGWRAITNGWWFAHEKMRSKARASYIGGHNARPEILGKYDVALVANVLLHNRDPLRILTNAADMAPTVIVVEQYHQELEAVGLPVAQFRPDPNAKKGQENWNGWWNFSTKYFENYLRVMGCTVFELTNYTLFWGELPIPYFTLVASK